MTAKDLLYKILDYRYLWILPQNRGSKPGKLRLEQIESLLEAFGLTKKSTNLFLQKDYSMLGVKQKLGSESHLHETVGLDDLVSGQFLRDRDNDSHSELSRKVIETIAALYPEMEDYINQRPINITWLFSDLLSFRQEVYQLTYPNGGMLEGFSAGLHYSFYLQDKLKALISDNLDEIDETLWLILDPTKRDLEMDMLVTKYKYVDHDFKGIDIDWMMENY